MSSVNTFSLTGGDLDGLVIKRSSSFSKQQDESTPLADRIRAEVNEMFDQGRIGATICLFTYADENAEDYEGIEPGPAGLALPEGEKKTLYRVNPILTPYIAPWSEGSSPYLSNSEISIKLSFGDESTSHRVTMSSLADFKGRKMSIPDGLNESDNVLLSKDGFDNIFFPLSLVEDFLDEGHTPNPNLIERISSNNMADANAGELFIGGGNFRPLSKNDHVGRDYIMKTLIPSLSGVPTTYRPTVLSAELSNIDDRDKRVKPFVSDVIGAKMPMPYNDPAVVHILFQVKADGATVSVMRKVRLSVMVDTYNSKDSNALAMCAFARWKRPKYKYNKQSRFDQMYRDLPSRVLSPDVD